MAYTKSVAVGESISVDQIKQRLVASHLASNAIALACAIGTMTIFAMCFEAESNRRAFEIALEYGHKLSPSESSHSFIWPVFLPAMIIPFTSIFVQIPSLKLSLFRKLLGGLSGYIKEQLWGIAAWELFVLIAGGFCLWKLSADGMGFDIERNCMILFSALLVCAAFPAFYLVSWLNRHRLEVEDVISSTNADYSNVLTL